MPGITFASPTMVIHSFVSAYMASTVSTSTAISPTMVGSSTISPISFMTARNIARNHAGDEANYAPSPG